MIPGPVAEGTHTAESLAPLEVDGQPQPIYIVKEILDSWPHREGKLQFDQIHLHFPSAPYTTNHVTWFNHMLKFAEFLIIHTWSAWTFIAKSHSKHACCHSVYCFLFYSVVTLLNKGGVCVHVHLTLPSVWHIKNRSNTCTMSVYASTVLIPMSC